MSIGVVTQLDADGAAMRLFRDDILRGLSAEERMLPSKYFYDEEGSRLFESICKLPEYYPTRTELSILDNDAPEMAEMLGPECLLIEYGSGSTCKTRLLLNELPDLAGYVPVDIAREQLEESSSALEREYPQLRISPLCSDFTGDLKVPGDAAGKRRVVYFPGSTIGNLTPGEAVGLLRRTARLCGAQGGLLLGVDQKKEPAVLTQAYNDAAGVTAAFNANMLRRINRELGADFRVDQFWHHAFYNPNESRIEMHLVSRQDQWAAVAGHSFFFAEGETLRTEYSYKYSQRGLQGLALAAGFAVERIWTDPRNYFCVEYWTVGTGD